jgi:hypothetical protein
LVPLYQETFTPPLSASFRATGFVVAQGRNSVRAKLACTRENIIKRRIPRAIFSTIPDVNSVKENYISFFRLTPGDHVQFQVVHQIFLVPIGDQQACKGKHHNADAEEYQTDKGKTCSHGIYNLVVVCIGHRPWDSLARNRILLDEVGSIESLKSNKACKQQENDCQDK